MIIKLTNDSHIFFMDIFWVLFFVFLLCIWNKSFRLVRLCNYTCIESLCTECISKAIIYVWKFLLLIWKSDPSMCIPCFRVTYCFDQLSIENSKFKTNVIDQRLLLTSIVEVDRTYNTIEFIKKKGDINICS